MKNLDRRSFIRSTLAVGSGVLFNPVDVLSRTPNRQGSMMGVHPFIHEHPDAVFIMRTNVDVKTNSDAMKQAGLVFGRSVFGLTDDSDIGVPLTHQYVIKPNLTCRMRNHDKYTVERSMGIVSDAHFTEGVIQSLKELEIGGSQIHLREVNCPDDLADGGYVDMADRTGVDLQCVETPYNELDPAQIQWVDMDDGIFFKKLPYIWPVNAPESWLLNIAKLKAHGMGMTLCAKNLQGTIVKNYQQHCALWGNEMNVSAEDVQPDAFNSILANYNLHVEQGIPRWEKTGNMGGLWMETWASRCLDNNSAITAGLHVIEGIYGRDGNFMDGPGENGLATDYMTNYIIFGLNQFYVDIIGHWIGGHEPGNFGLFHMAREHGRIATMNPANIPVYNWDPDLGATLTGLDKLERYALKTYYLQTAFNGVPEDYWHMVNEPVNYAAFSDPATVINPRLPKLGVNYPNPVREITHIPFQITNPGHVHIEVINEVGAVVDVLVSRMMPAGSHMITWDSSRRPAGLYLYLMRNEGTEYSGKMLVIH
ncbi:MAG: DUF362 domain-containing protein [Bacteroidota bacterium]